MYSNIQVVATENENKYLFINDSNVVYGGIIIKEIVELLKESKSNIEIYTKLSLKYGHVIQQELINAIINEKLQSLLIDKQKEKSLKILFKYNLKHSWKLSNNNSKLFVKNFFYPFFIFLLSLNIILYFTINAQSLNSIFQSSIAYILLILILIMHEFGHIASANNSNTVVKEMGFGIYRFIPVIYVNLDEIWKLPPHQRIIINLAGIYYQLIISIFIILLYYCTGMQFFAFLFKINLMVIILNLNPFFQFDGYWVLTDLLNINNLKNESNFYLKNILKNTKIRLSVKIYSVCKVFLVLSIIFHLIIKIREHVT